MFQQSGNFRAKVNQNWISIYEKLGYSTVKNEKIKRDVELIHLRKGNRNLNGQ